MEGNAEQLPFEDNSVDAYTIAFGIRNVTDRDAALREAHRSVLQGTALQYRGARPVGGQGVGGVLRTGRYKKVLHCSAELLDAFYDRLCIGVGE